MDRKRIMVVDDEIHFTRLLKMTLEEGFSYNVLVENDPRRAFDIAIRFHPDLVLMDVMMPGIDGGALAAQFMANAQLRTVPIVFITAAVKREEVHARQGQIGGLSFLAKPVDLEELVRCLHRTLAGECCSQGPQISRSMLHQE